MVPQKNEKWMTTKSLGGGFKYVFNDHPYFGEIPILTISYVSNGLKPPTRSNPIPSI